MNKIASFILIILISSSSAYADSVIGQPARKASCDNTGCDYDNLTRDQQAKYQMVITGNGGRWYWTSREGKELVATPGGFYINYVNPEGSGSVKLELRTDDDGQRSCEYFEHIHQGLSTITYWGSCRIEGDLA